MSTQLPVAGLSEDELAKFHEQGFIGPFRVYEEDEVAEMWRSVRRKLFDRSNAAYQEAADYSISNYDRHLDVDELSTHIMKRSIVNRVQSILGEDLLCWRSEFFPKYPGDEGTDWHQADTFANASGSPQLVWGKDREKSAHGGTLTTWTAFTRADEETGCLQFIPGTHRSMNYDESKKMEYDESRVNSEVKDGVRRGFFGYDYRELQTDPDWKPAEEDAVSIVMKPGEVVLFWSTLMHASLPNITETDYRMGFAARYVPPGVKVYPDTDILEEFGGSVSLERYSPVLASGSNTTEFNTVADTSLSGFPFQAVP